MGFGMFGDSWSPPQPKPILTVTLRGRYSTVFATGICEDETKFKDAQFASLLEAMRYLERQYKATFRVILNIHPSARSI